MMHNSYLDLIDALHSGDYHRDGSVRFDFSLETNVLYVLNRKTNIDESCSLIVFNEFCKNHKVWISSIRPDVITFYYP